MTSRRFQISVQKSFLICFPKHNNIKLVNDITDIGDLLKVYILLKLSRILEIFCYNLITITLVFNKPWILKCTQEVRTNLAKLKLNIFSIMMRPEPTTDLWTNFIESWIKHESFLSKYVFQFVKWRSFCPGLDESIYQWFSFDRIQNCFFVICIV